LHGLDRARYYFDTSQATALNMGLTYNWEKHELPNVGHNPQLMANDALQFFLPNFLSLDSVEENKLIKIFPNPISTDHLNFSTNLNRPISVAIFNILGEEVLKTIMEKHILNISGLKSGFYLLKIESDTFSTTKKLIVK
tara:strand:+ start:12 stop:428 length:417 start_codon:yes stop_codon:yes gene_type:complete